MVESKRKRRQDSEQDWSDCSQDSFSAGLSLNLPRKQAKVSSSTDEEDDNDGLKDVIQKTTTRRDVKGGTAILKKAKGKGKMTKGEVGGGSFQSMGLHQSLLRSLTLQGYRIPTPIQRLSIPAILSNPPRDVVGMARTGSGKSLAYMIPLVQRLGNRHRINFGARALILLPTRELALQLLKVGKELVRGWHASNSAHAGDAKDLEDQRGQGLRWGLVVGGESLDDQFEMLMDNPDIIIATPGRLLHLLVEMSLDLKLVQYVVFDEADRLFEMGFETALNEIIHRLPASRQTLLFSATLPKSLVDFAKAGLQDPKLIRLDAESKISSDLKMAFFSVKPTEKDACLLSLLRDVIKVPFASAQPLRSEATSEGSKSPMSKNIGHFPASSHQTLIFTATKHHVEYLLTLLTTAGYAASHIYSSLDQSARMIQMDQFRRGFTSILVVTDIAARGIDIPVLENVINFDFPHGSRVFVHRVGRTARAGRQGWAWSFVTQTELPYLLDLQLFLARPLRNQVSGDGDQPYTESLIVGTFQREQIDEDLEYVRALDEENHTLSTLREVMKRGHAMYERSKGKASHASYKTAKEMLVEGRWLVAGVDSGVHPVLLRGVGGQVMRAHEEKRKELLKVVSSFRPNETAFEIGKRGETGSAALMRERRKALTKAVGRAGILKEPEEKEVPEEGDERIEMEIADEAYIATVFDTSNKINQYRDPNFYMSYYQKDAATDKGFSLRDGASFAEQARNVTFGLVGDEGVAERKRRQLTWDKKKKKFVKGDGTGADNVKMVKTESGTKLPATYRSGRFDEWKATNRVQLPNIGDAEPQSRGRPNRGAGGRKFKHQKVVAAKPLDKLAKNYDRKLRHIRKREESGEQSGDPARPSANGVDKEKGKGPKIGGRYGRKPLARIKTELKTTEQIRKGRNMLAKKRAKNARPSRKRGKR